MSSLVDIFNVTKIKDLIFGENNSRIDNVLDYFYSLRQEKRTKIIFYTIVSLILFFVLILFLYFFGLNKLQNNLNNAINHRNELNIVKSNFSSVSNEYNKILEILKNDNDYKTISNDLDLKAKELGLDIAPLPEKPTILELQNTDIFFGQFKKINIDISSPNISLRKIILYLNEIKSMNHRLKVKSIEIQQKFDSKLYFDLKLTLEAYVSIEKL